MDSTETRRHGHGSALSIKMLRAPVSLREVVAPDCVVRNATFQSFGNTSSTASELLVYCDNRRALRLAMTNAQVMAVLVRPDMVPDVREGLGVATSTSPRSCYYAIVNDLTAKGAMRPALEQSGRGRDCQIHPSSYLDESVLVGDRVSVGPGAIIHAGVSIDDDAVISSGVTIGCPGILHYLLLGKRYQVTHTGGVHIGKRANLLARSVVVQGIFPGQPTVIGDDCIVGIQTIVGHEAVIGERVVVSGNCVIARASHVHDDAYLATGCIVREYCSVGANARCLAGSVVVADVPPGCTVSGNFAENHSARMRRTAQDNRRERAAV